MGGVTCGFVANRTAKFDAQGSTVETYDPVITSAGAKKAAGFVRFCDAFSIPVISLVNTRGLSATVCGEKHLPKSCAALAGAFAQATTPKISLITKEAYGTAYLMMNSKACGADLVFAYDSAKIGMMDAAAASKVTGRSAAETETFNSIGNAAAAGLVDAVIPEAETRKYLIGAVEMFFTKREEGPYKKHGTI